MRKKPTASYSRCSRSAGSHGSIAGMRQRLALRRAAEQFVLADRRRLVAALRGRQHGVDRREGARAVRLELVERAGRGQAFQHALVDRARIDAAREVGEIGERPARRAPSTIASHRLRADALERRQRIADRCRRATSNIDARAVDRRRLDLDAEPLGLARGIPTSLSVLPMSSVIDAARNSTG